MTRLLDIDGLTTEIVSGSRTVRPVDEISLQLDAGEALAIVGESGSGKSMTALSILRLLPPGGRIVAGHVYFEGRDLAAMRERELLKFRGKEIGVVFQDPMTFLNPIQTIGTQVCEALSLHAAVRGDVRAAARATLSLVGIPRPEQLFNYYPHQLSGGMRQRVLIAIAVACKPRLLIADEPTTALDVTTQAQIMALIGDLRRELGSSLILITHDLGLVAEHCDRVCVMYAGRIVEQCPTAELFAAPKHPYTRALLRSMLTTDRRIDFFEAIGGQPPDLRHLPPGCRFHPRCDDSFAQCRVEEPLLQTLDAGRQVRCWLYADGAP